MGGRSGQSVNSSGSKTSNVSIEEIQVKGYTGKKLTDEEKKYFSEFAQKVIKNYGIEGDVKINTYYKKDNAAGSYNIKVMKPDGTFYGSSYKTEEISINLKNLKTKEDIERNIKHELKHVHQGQNGLYIKHESDGSRNFYWKGEKFGSVSAVHKLMGKHETYMKLPWEIDARSTEKDKY